MACGLSCTTSEKYENIICIIIRLTVVTSMHTTIHNEISHPMKKELYKDGSDEFFI
jgi:hypothetical protein